MQKFQLIPSEILDAWIKAGKKINLLDVRPSSQRNEANIPGSLHTDQYDLIKAEATKALRNIHLDKSVPVITFCNGGKVANAAAAILGDLGYDAYSLEGGLDQWKAGLTNIPSSLKMSCKPYECCYPMKAKAWKSE